MEKIMRTHSLVLIILMAQGCSNLQMNPGTGLEVAPLNLIDDSTAALVIDSELENMIFTSKPTAGKLYSKRHFDIRVGKPLTEHVYRQIKELLPNIVKSNSSSIDNYDLVISLKLEGIEFGILNEILPPTTITPEGSILGLMIWGSAKTASYAKLSIVALINGKHGDHEIAVFGEGVEITSIMSAGETSLTKALEKAIIDVSHKLALRIESVVIGSTYKRMQMDLEPLAALLDH